MINRKRQLTNKMTAMIFFLLLLVIFILAAIVSWPVGKKVAIQEEGKAAFSELRDRWFSLEADSYEVIGEFAEFTTHHSTFFYPIKYYYFNVLVTDRQGQQFIMAVRTGKKTEVLREGKTIGLYGMISQLDTGRIEAQINSLYEVANGRDVYNISLNDNDSSVVNQYMKSVFFIFCVILDLVFMYIILIRKRS